MTNFRRSALALTMACILVLIEGSGIPALGGPIVPRGHYCLTFGHGGSDCSFTSYQQCLETVSGIDAECYGKTAIDDSNDQAQGRRNVAPRLLHMQATPPTTWRRMQD
jgi:hypothetical protein